MIMENLDLKALRSMTLSVYAYDYDEEADNLQEACDQNIGFKSIVMPLLVMEGGDDNEPIYRKVTSTHKWLYRLATLSGRGYQVWFMIDGNFHLDNTRGVHFGDNTPEIVEQWVEALLDELLNIPWTDDCETPPAQMEGLLGFHFDIEPCKQDTHQLSGFCIFLEKLRQGLDEAGFEHLQLSIYAHADLLTDPENTKIYSALNMPNCMVMLVGADLGPALDIPLSPYEYRDALVPLVESFVQTAGAVEYQGRLGLILPAAGQESEFAYLSKAKDPENRDIEVDFEWNMHDYTLHALETAQIYAHKEGDDHTPHISELLFWRLAPWPLTSESGVAKRPASLTHRDHGNAVGELLATIWPKV